MSQILVKRVYDSPADSDGERFLVDRLWPRGIKKEALALNGWLPEAAPSNTLRKWFNHDPAKWDEFKARYTAELKENPSSWEALARSAQKGSLTLLYAARDAEHNNAVALKEFLEKTAPAKAKSRGKKKVAATATAGQKGRRVSSR